MQVVLLCGGQGTRLREQTEFMPKPLVRVGNVPILWHIMKKYSQHGHDKFVLCLGYKGDMIKQYFLDYRLLASDFTLKVKDHSHAIHSSAVEDWHITFADTGQKSLTGTRLRMVQKYITDDTFLLTYGDGVSDVDINEVISYHKAMGKVATITGFHPRSKYGVVHVNESGLVYQFSEKPATKDIINGGFMVFDKKVFDYIPKDQDIMLEDVFPLLAKDNQLALFKSEGFFFAMDTQRDFEEINKIWESGNAPWKNW